MLTFRYFLECAALKPRKAVEGDAPVKHALLQGLLTVLEYCLEHSASSYSCFEQFINALGYNTVQFWRYAVPYIYDSDLTYGTKFRDSLLFSLTLFDVNNGKSKLRCEPFSAVKDATLKMRLPKAVFAMQCVVRSRRKLSVRF
ncbi:unnamed protein product [Gongylonema pulchrum]|uniref:RUN domain-containing protein n=1 Tax=Gongylonema pulchrum TaxID=637853 RepID=A0A183F0V1_9BILA|nr:unnamed protein product [Gongylonema pulchrum]